MELNQFAIRNDARRLATATFAERLVEKRAITFCNGDLDPDTKRAALQRLGLKPPKFVK
jgi:hypothetical protein